MDSGTAKTRTYYGYLEGIVSIVVNVVLAFIKFLVGIHINSIALIADGLHSLSDLFTSIVVILGFKSAQKPPDKEHPFGHGRSEDIASLIIAILLSVVGIEFFVTSVERLMHPEVVKGTFLFFIIVILTVVVKEVLAQYSVYLSKRIDSPALLADAWHHRSDALGSIPVAIGILASAYGYYHVDSLSGMIVSGIIIYVGYGIAKDAINDLLGKAPPGDFMDKIKSLAHSEGVIEVSDIYVHKYGTKNVISLNAKVEPMTLEKAHSIADSIEKRIAKNFDASVMVHIDVFKVDASIKKEIYSMVKEHEEVISCHAITVEDKIEFHILVNKTMSVEDAHNLAHHLQEDISTRFKRAVRIHVEPCIDECEKCVQDCEAKGLPAQE
ncbi:MAG: cation diffusion facilitator family transporter [Theionarchaea archaeon]|nr:cation diffusion facilitator family transporter [Theionarchaea archaeon]